MPEGLHTHSRVTAAVSSHSHSYLVSPSHCLHSWLLMCLTTGRTASSSRPRHEEADKMVAGLGSRTARSDTVSRRPEVHRRLPTITVMGAIVVVQLVLSPLSIHNMACNRGPHILTQQCTAVWSGRACCCISGCLGPSVLVPRSDRL